MYQDRSVDSCCTISAVDFCCTNSAVDVYSAWKRQGCIIHSPSSRPHPPYTHTTACNDFSSHKPHQRFFSRTRLTSLKARRPPRQTPGLSFASLRLALASLASLSLALSPLSRLSPSLSRLSSSRPLLSVPSLPLHHPPHLQLALHLPHACLASLVLSPQRGTGHVQGISYIVVELRMSSYSTV